MITIVSVMLHAYPSFQPDFHVIPESLVKNNPQLTNLLNFERTWFQRMLNTSVNYGLFLTIQLYKVFLPFQLSSKKLYGQRNMPILLKDICVLLIINSL